MISGDYITIPGLIAGTGLTTSQYTPMLLSSTAARTVLQATVTTRTIIGVLMNDPATGEPAEVATLGVCKAIAGTSTITRGEKLSANSTGVIDVTAGRTFAIAIDAPSAKSDLIMIALTGDQVY